MVLGKAIARGRFISYKGTKHWVHSCYETLPKICFQCGSVLDGDQGCQSAHEGKGEAAASGSQFWPWLRAEGATIRWASQSSYGRSKGGKEAEKDSGTMEVETSTSILAKGLPKKEVETSQPGTTPILFQNHKFVQNNGTLAMGGKDQLSAESEGLEIVWGTVPMLAMGEK